MIDTEYLTNGTRYRHSFNALLIGTYTRHTKLTKLNSTYNTAYMTSCLQIYMQCVMYSTVSFRMTFSDLERPSKIFNDTKRRAVSLRQLSFLSYNN